MENANSKYLFNLIPGRHSLYSTRDINNIPVLNTKYNIFKNTFFPFFPYTIIKLYNLDPRFRKSESFPIFKTNILKFIQLSSNSLYIYNKPRGICVIARLRLSLSHLKEKKFKHVFQHTINLLCSCDADSLMCLSNLSQLATVC